MATLDLLYEEASKGLVAKQYERVVALFEEASAKEQEVGVLGDYLCGIALLGQARLAPGRDDVKALAQHALERFSRVLQIDAQARVDGTLDRRIPRPVLASCNYEMAEGFRLLGYESKAEKRLDAARELALFYTGLTKTTVQARSGLVGPELPPITNEEFLRATLPVVEELDATHRRAAADLEEILNARFAGRPFTDIDGHKAAVAHLRHLLGRMERRLECPTCHEPAMPSVASSSKAGQFQYRHDSTSSEGSHGGGSTFPKLSVVELGPDARRGHK